MTQDQGVILLILAATVVLFVWGRVRHDLVALASLLACVLAGLVVPAQAFEGFGHPAVITVACVLVLSYGLQTSGAIDLVTDRVMPRKAGPWVSIAALIGLGAVLSAFMNNVGALALLMPVAIQIAQRHDLPPGQVLMPLAVGSILGGMTTLIGTPPNLIVAGFREETGLGSFTMFDFAPVGVVVAAAGIAFVLIFGRWLIPARERSDASDFDVGAYLTEARVTEESKAVGMTLRAVDDAMDEFGAQIVGLVRNEVRMDAPHGNHRIRPGDILVLEAEPKSLVSTLQSVGLRLEEDKRAQESGDEQKKDADGAGAGKKSRAAVTPAESKAAASSETGPDEEDEDERRPEEIVLMELVVMPGSSIVNRNAKQLMLRSRYGINLLAVSRQGRRSTGRLRTLRFTSGDVLLMQAPPETLADFATQTGCVPLADRALRLPRPKHALIAGLVMLMAVGAAGFGLAPAAIAFAAGVVVLGVTRVVPPRKIYDAVDWPVIVLLGALIPVAGAMATTGTADLIADALLEWVAGGSPVIAIAVLLIATMTLSDFMNNAATAAVMCPIAISAAYAMGASPDPFLMAVAVGASCAFLTPIGHQNNTIILGPGGFRFGDYWRLGLPLEIIVIAVSIPMILMVWPL